MGARRMKKKFTKHLVEQIILREAHIKNKSNCLKMERKNEIIFVCYRPPH
jgi:hypothetical protein